MKAQPNNPFDQFFAEAEKDVNYWVEMVILEFTEQTLARMKELNISKSQLAEKLGVSPAFVTKLLRGTNNYTLQTMVKVARALDCEYLCHLQPHRAKSRQFYSMEPDANMRVAEPRKIRYGSNKKS